jgi:hypothetical protein
MRVYHSTTEPLAFNVRISRYAHVINTFQTLLAPLFLGLFALALRQRLKR